VLIQNPTISRRLQTNLRLTHPPDSILAPETVAVIIVDDYTSPIDDESRGCAGANVVGAVAAERGLCGLIRVNPNQYDLVVSGVMVTCQTAQLFDLRIPTVAVTGPTPSGNTNFVDFNLPGRPSTQLVVDTNAVAIVGRNLLTFECDGLNPVIIPLGIRIGTGDPVGSDTIILQSQSNNLPFQVSWTWTEGPPLG